LIEISGEYFISGGITQTLMRLNGIVEINETEKLNVPIGTVFIKAVLQRLEPLVGTVTRDKSWSLARFSMS